MNDLSIPKQKPINYIYNKQMLKKIQVVTGDRKVNEMEMKNYSEELNTHLHVNNHKKKLIQAIKEKAFKNLVYMNKSVPSEWRTKLDYQNFSTKLLSKDKQLLDYLVYMDQEAIYKESSTGKKNAFYNKMVNMRKLEKDRHIARLFQNHKEIKRQISTMIKGDDNFLVTQSIFGENFVVTNDYNANSIVKTQKYRNSNNNQNSNNNLNSNNSSVKGINNNDYDFNKLNFLDNINLSINNDNCAIKRKSVIKDKKNININISNQNINEQFKNDAINKHSLYKDISKNIIYKNKVNNKFIKNKNNDPNIADLSTLHTDEKSDRNDDKNTRKQAVEGFILNTNHSSIMKNKNTKDNKRRLSKVNETNNSSVNDSVNFKYIKNTQEEDKDGNSDKEVKSKFLPKLDKRKLTNQTISAKENIQEENKKIKLIEKYNKLESVKKKLNLLNHKDSDIYISGNLNGLESNRELIEKIKTSSYLNEYETKYLEEVKKIKSKEADELMKKLHTSLEEIERYGLRAAVQLKKDVEKSKMKVERGVLICNNLSKPENKNSQYDININKSKEEVFHPNKFHYFISQKQNKFKGDYKLNDDEIRDLVFEVSDNGHFGPYTSFCNHCNKKNVDFYNNIEKTTGVNILNHLLHPIKSSNNSSKYKYNK